MIGELLYEKTDVMDFYLNKDSHYGMLLDKNWKIVYFEFDGTLPLNETTGVTNGHEVLEVTSTLAIKSSSSAALVIQTNDLISWYFDRESLTFLVIGYE